MDKGTVSSYSILIYIILTIGVKSSSLDKTTFRSFVPTVPTDLTTKFPIIQSSGSQVDKNYEKFSNENADDVSTEDDVEGAPPDHIIPHTDHENPEEPSTRSKYGNPGGWSTSSPKVELDFVPTKLYAQVRNTHTVKHLPRDEALKSATNEEEILAASRLREVVSKSKTNTIYTEEGYEDAAYDHGGHVRDADFHDGYARKPGNQENNKQNRVSKKPEVDKKEEISSDSAEEFNNYDDDYGDHDSSIVKESKIQNQRIPKEMEEKRYKSIWQDSWIDPKRVTENEIERLEIDLEKEYEESEKNTETRIPENLKNPREDEEDEERESLSESDTAGNRHYEMKVDKENDESEETSSEFPKKLSSIESRMNEIRDDSSASPEEIEDISKSINSSADFGKIFCDYFKSVGNNHHLQEFSEPKNIVTTSLNDPETSVDEVSTSVPKFATVLTTHADFDSTFNPLRMEFSDFFVTSRMDNNYPSAASLYESWKRRDDNKNSEESPDTNYESSDSYVTNFEDTKDTEDSEKKSSLNLTNDDDDSVTPIVGKKLSYTVIIRPSEKPTTKNTPCDREDYTRTGERIPVVKTTYTKMSNHSRDQVSPEAINDFSVPNDFTVIRPPLPLPLRQVTYANFLPDSYASLARPSVTREIETIGEQINNGERDRYEPLKNPYANRGHHPQSRYNRYRGYKRNPHFLPITKLVPPSPINTSKYSNYLGVKRVGKPLKILDRSLNLWPEFMRFYRSVDRTIFRRRRRSLDERRTDDKTILSIDSGKTSDVSVEASTEKKLRLKRNFFREPNRLLVGADNAEPEKSIGSGTRKRRSNERLLHEAPRIVDKVINDEIESRFKDEDTEEDEEKRGNIQIEVPDFNFSDKIENNERRKVIAKRPNKVASLDNVKYPFYENSKVSRTSALKYITNPRSVPRKTLGGTEFYDSRDRYRECDEVKPSLDSVLPEEEEPSENREPRGDQPRLRGLGDSLDCFRAKYFDDDPLDNPLFLEEQVGQPRIPEELDPTKLASKIFTTSNDEQVPQVVRRISRRPEQSGSENDRGRSKKNQFTHNEGKSYATSRKDMRSEKQSTKQGEKNREARRRRRRRRKPLQTTTEAPELPVTPYERQVYEDVMGTIKNLAGLYQTFGEPISSSSLRSNLNHDTVTPREKNVGSQTVHITERPRGFAFRGLPPPPPPHRYRIIPYRTNKVSYRTRTRTESPMGEGGVSKVGYFRTVTVHKRSVNDENISLDLNGPEAGNIGKIVSNNETNGVTYLKRSKAIKVDEKPATPKRMVYTIRDRIRHSKPKGISGKYGKFTNLEVSATEDARRREPRYNRIRRKNVSSADDEPATTIRWKESEDDPKDPIVSAKGSSTMVGTSGGHNYHDEPDELYKIQYSTTRGRQIEPNNLKRRDVDVSSEADYEEDKELVEGDAKKKKQMNNYDVHENLEDDITTISSVVEPTRGPTFFKLHEYLQSDPPGYSEAFDEKSIESSSRYSEDKEPEKSYKITETRREPKDDSGDEESEDAERQVEGPLELRVDEESSAKSEEDDDSPEQSESYKNPEDGEENKKEEGEGEEEEEEVDEEEETHSPQVDDESTSHLENDEKEFERFASRPFSPFESYDDPKYTDLGPRLSKPSFHHPSFSSVNYRRRESENTDSKERDDKKSRYVFPWHAHRANDEEDIEDSNEKYHKIERYEYPWERRERLSRERRRKAKEREKYRRLYGFFPDSDEEDDDDEENKGSHTQLHERHVYPWEYYKVPSRNSHRAKATRRIIDNEEMSSDYKPRFSSRYKTKSFHGNADNETIDISEADPREINISMTSSIEKASKEKPNNSSEFVKIQSRATTSDASFISTLRPAVFTVASKEPRKTITRMQIVSTTPSIISSTGTNRKMRIWRTPTSTTKKPVSRKRKDAIVNKESLELGSRKENFVINPAQRINLTSSLMDSSGSSLGIARKSRRRGPTINLSTTWPTTFTGRPVRRRIPKTTPIPEEKKSAVEESTMRSIIEKNTTPKVKTFEHRSRFSKEEIITKTSYPGFNNDSYNNTEQNNTDGGNFKQSYLKKRMPNESIKKVSIMTNETPDHIYRTEEINKNGVKGMFISITPNNGTNSSMDTIQDLEDRFINPEETGKMLKIFQDSVENNEEEDPEISFTRDSHLIANLLKQVPPYVNHLSMDDGSVEEDEDGTGIDIRTNYVKHPNHRLYYYVENP